MTRLTMVNLISRMLYDIEILEQACIAYKNEAISQEVFNKVCEENIYLKKSIIQCESERTAVVTMHDTLIDKLLNRYHG